KVAHGGMAGLGVGIGIDGDGAHPHAASRGGDAAGDFAAIGNQQCFKHGYSSLHAEDAETGGVDGGVQGGGKRQREHAPGVGRANDAVVPQPGGGVVGVAFVLVLLTNGSLEGLFFVGAPAAAAALDAVAAHGGQHAGGLFAAHDGDACVGPHVQHARAECATTHAVVAGTKGAADDHGELGDGRGGHRCHHLGAVPGNPFVLVFATHHEAGDVLQEDQRNAALAAQFDEVGAFLGGFRKQDAVVGDDAYRHAVDMGESGHQRRAEACLEFIEFGAVDDTGDDFAHVVGFAGVGGNDAV